MIRLVAKLQERSVASGTYDEPPVLKIGRAPDNDLRIENLALSNHHAEIRCAGGVYTLRDLSSSNGSFVNGERVAQRCLNDGDVIGIGKFSIVVTLEPSGPLPLTIPDRARYNELSKTDRVTTVASAAGQRVNAHLLRQGRLRGDDVVCMQEDVFLVGASADSHLRVRGLRSLRRLALIVRGSAGYRLISFATVANTVRRNGEPVQGREWLEDGDQLQFGRIHATFREGAPARSRRSA